MQVYLDKNGYVTSYAIVGTLVDGIEVNTPIDLEHFKEYYQAYKLTDNALVFDKNQELIIEQEMFKQELRDRRENECFTIINRGQLWYDSLSSIQRSELYDWYNAWLIVTETLEIPKKPEWL